MTFMGSPCSSSISSLNILRGLRGLSINYITATSQKGLHALRLLWTLTKLFSLMIGTMLILMQLTSTLDRISFISKKQKGSSFPKSLNATFSKSVTKALYSFMLL
jgi:hypothetical protein